MIYRFAMVVVVGTVLSWNVWRYPVVGEMLCCDAATELRYCRDDLPQSSPPMATVLQEWGEKLRSLSKKSGDVEGEDKQAATSPPEPAGRSPVRSKTPRSAQVDATKPKPNDSSLLPPLPQGEMPIPRAASSWSSAPVSDTLPRVPHSLAEGDATPLFASQFTELSPIPPPATTPPSSSEPPPLVVAPPAPLAGGVWLPPAL